MKSLKEVVAEVKLAYDLADYISHAGVNLKKTGPGKWKGLCPFHSEKTGSFVVDDRFQNYRCFGCGASGDLITYVQHAENLDFFEAVIKLAEDKNIPVELNNDAPDVDRKSIRRCLTATALFFYKHFLALPETHPAKTEISKRKLPEDDKFYGYAPEKRGALLEFLRKKGFSDQTIIQAGVCGKSENGKMYDFWSGRLMFFIRDISGNVVGFSGRKLFESDNRGKYVNSPDGPLFKKGNVLFNLSSAKKTAAEKQVIHIVEGQFDVAAMRASGLRNTAASSGTAFTQEQASICRRLVGDQGKIIFCLDGDEAGQSAARKIFKKCRNIQEMSYVIVFPENQDPCDYRLHNGAEELNSFCSNNQMNIIDFMLSYEESKIDFDTETGRSDYVLKVAPILKTITSAPLKENYARKVSLQSFVSLDIVRQEIEKAEIGNEVDSFEDEKKEIQEPERPALEENENEINIVEKIESDEVYEISARWISLAMRNSEIKMFISENVNLLPEEMETVVNEMKSMEVYVPEKFSNSELARKIIETNFFPLSEQMTERDFLDLSMRFKELLINKEKELNVRRVKAAVSRYLNNSPGTTDFLKSALVAEEKKLKELNLYDIQD